MVVINRPGSDHWSWCLASAQINSKIPNNTHKALTSKIETIFDLHLNQKDASYLLQVFDWLQDLSTNPLNAGCLKTKHIL